MKRVAIIGSHGLEASYGGFDQLVNNIVKYSGSETCFFITQPRSTEIPKNIPKNVKISKSKLDAPGIEGVIFDSICILKYFFKVDSILLLGAGAFPLIFFLSLFRKNKIIVNNGGIEWERDKFGRIAKHYHKFVFDLSARFSDVLILDNKTFVRYMPKTYKAELAMIPYGGTISEKYINPSNQFYAKYPFLEKHFFLSVSRAIEDNNILEICECFSKSSKQLVLISNFSSSDYGRKVFSKFKKYKNIFLINGLYDKNELDMIRLKCSAYIHTHQKCGTAPSLVEMIIANKPIISIDVEANRFTLMNQGKYFKNFEELFEIIENETDYQRFAPEKSLPKKYSWKNIAEKYLELF